MPWGVDLSNGSGVEFESTLSVDVASGATSMTLQDASGFPYKGYGGIDNYFFTWDGKNGNTLVNCKLIRRDFPSQTTVVYRPDATSRGINTALELSEKNHDPQQLLYRHKAGKWESTKFVEVDGNSGHAKLHSLFSNGFANPAGDLEQVNENEAYFKLRQTWISKIFERNSAYVVSAEIESITKNSDNHDAYDIQLNQTSNYNALETNFHWALITIATSTTTITDYFFCWQQRDGKTLRGCRFASDLPDGFDLTDIQASSVVRDMVPRHFGTTAENSSEKIIIPLELSLRDNSTMNPSKIPGSKEVSPGIHVFISDPGKRVSFYSNTISIDGPYNEEQKGLGIIGFKQYFGEIDRGLSLGISLDELLLRTYNPYEYMTYDRSPWPDHWDPNSSRANGKVVYFLYMLTFYVKSIKWVQRLLTDLTNDMISCLRVSELPGKKYGLRQNSYYQFPGNSTHGSKRVSYIVKPVNIIDTTSHETSWEYHKKYPTRIEIERPSESHDWPFVDDCLAALHPNGSLDPVSCGEIITVNQQQLQFVGVHEARLIPKRPRTEVKFHAVEVPGFERYAGGTNRLFDSPHSNIGPGFREYSGHGVSNESGIMSTRRRQTEIWVSTSAKRSGGQLGDHFHLYTSTFSTVQKKALISRLGKETLLSDNQLSEYDHDFMLADHYCTKIQMWHGSFEFTPKSEEISRFTQEEFLYVNFAELGENSATVARAKQTIQRYKAQDIINAKDSFVSLWNQTQNDQLRPDPLNSELTSIGEYGDFVVRINDMLKRYNFPHNRASDRSYSMDTRKGVIMLKEMMYDMNPELCVALQITDSNGDMDCTLESNACQGSCGCYTWGCWVYHTVTASEGIPIQPLDWQALKNAYDSNDGFNPFEDLDDSNLVFDASQDLWIQNSNQELDLLVKPGWVIHLQMDGYVDGNHRTGYFHKKGFGNTSRSQYVVLRGGDRIAIGNSLSSPTWAQSSPAWDDFGDEFAVYYQTKQQAEISGNLYEVYYFNNTNSNRKIRFQISCITRPFATQPFELAAGWGSESGLGALARLIQQITDSMALTAEGMFGFSLSWNDVIELNMEQHFIIEIPLGEDSPVTYCFDYRAGFAAFRDVDLLGSTSFSASIHGEKYVVPKLHWGASVRYLLWDTMAAGASKWVVDEPRRPRAFQQIISNESTTLAYEAELGPYGHALELRWDGIYASLAELEARIELMRYKLEYNWTPGAHALLFGGDLNNPIYDHFPLVSTPFSTPSSALDDAKDLTSKTKHMKTQRFNVLEIEEDNFVGLKFGFGSNTTGIKQNLDENIENNDPLDFDRNQFNIPDNATDLAISDLKDKTGASLEFIGGFAKHSIGLNLNIPIPLPYNFKFVGRFHIKCTGEIEFPLTEPAGGED